MSNPRASNALPASNEGLARATLSGTAPARTGLTRRTVASGIALFALFATSLPDLASGFEMNSASYTSRGAATNAGSIAQVSTAGSPGFSSAAGSMGQAEAVGLTGSATSLRTSRSGFWPIVGPDLVSLDLDDDGIQSFFDPDDDNDGLDDVVETNTGVFVSAFDTGSDPLNPDTDSDGLDDGAEVAAGTDPNVHEVQLPVPAMSGTGRVLVVLGVVLFGSGLLATRKETQQ
jgi:hypothetical protein